MILSESDGEAAELHHNDLRRYRSSPSSFVPVSGGILLSQTGIKTYQIQTVAGASRVWVQSDAKSEDIVHFSLLLLGLLGPFIFLVVVRTDPLVLIPWK